MVLSNNGLHELYGVDYYSTVYYVDFRQRIARIFISYEEFYFNSYNSCNSLWKYVIT